MVSVGICAYLTCIKRNTLRSIFIETFRYHQHKCPHGFLFTLMSSRHNMEWSPSRQCREEWSHLFMLVEVGTLQAGCVAAWLTAARSQVGISKCCHPVNKTLTCTLLWHFKPSVMQANGTAQSMPMATKRKWGQLTARCGCLLFSPALKISLNWFSVCQPLDEQKKHPDVVSLTGQED